MAALVRSTEFRSDPDKTKFGRRNRRSLPPFATVLDVQTVLAVGQAMRDYTVQVLTPGCRSPENTYGVVEGAGMFLELQGQPLLLARKSRGPSLCDSHDSQKSPTKRPDPFDSSRRFRNRF